MCFVFELTQHAIRQLAKIKQGKLPKSRDHKHRNSQVHTLARWKNNNKATQTTSISFLGLKELPQCRHFVKNIYYHGEFTTLENTQDEVQFMSSLVVHNDVLVPANWNKSIY